MESPGANAYRGFKRIEVLAAGPESQKGPALAMRSAPLDARESSRSVGRPGVVQRSRNPLPRKADCALGKKMSINPDEAITGNYTDARSASHGFLRANDGAITAFDAPGAGTGAFQGTVPASINPAGAITGSYSDAKSVS